MSATNDFLLSPGLSRCDTPGRRPGVLKPRCPDPRPSPLPCASLAPKLPGVLRVSGRLRGGMVPALAHLRPALKTLLIFLQLLVLSLQPPRLPVLLPESLVLSLQPGSLFGKYGCRLSGRARRARERLDQDVCQSHRRRSSARSCAASDLGVAVVFSPPSGIPSG